MRRLMLGVGFFALFAGASLGQDTRAKVQGIVTDSSSAVVVGANVMLRNEDTAVQAQQPRPAASVVLVFDTVMSFATVNVPSGTGKSTPPSRMTKAGPLPPPPEIAINLALAEKFVPFASAIAVMTSLVLM